LDYPGSDIATLRGVTSAINCQMECQKNADCQSFTYDLSNKNCWLKNTTPAKHELNFVISGPKKCYEGENKIKLA
jgi:hypothetical protein